jgi:elongator complex protein 5
VYPKFLHLAALTLCCQNPAADPTTNLSFSLNLTPSQQAARAQVPLPYAHQGHLYTVLQPLKADCVLLIGGDPKVQGAIYYDPDSADDIDDDDPDEDLDI